MLGSILGSPYLGKLLFEGPWDLAVLVPLKKIE